MNLISDLSPLLVKLLIKSSLIIAIGYALILIGRKASSEWKHRVLRRAFAIANLIPLVLILPRWEVLPDRTAVPQATLIATSPAVMITPSRSEAISIPLAEDSGWRPSIADSFVLVWLFGSIVLLLRTGIASARLRRLASSSSKPSERLREIFSAVAKERPTPEVSLLLSDRIASPFSCGLIRPAIHLPISAETWQKDEVEMIFRHELALVRRRDALAVFLSRIFLAVNWLNPLAWFANRRAIQLREEACDESVLAAGHEPTTYAEMLFRQASSRNERFLQSCATSMAETGTIEKRIQMILKPNPEIHRKSSHLGKIAVAAFTLLFLVVGFVGSQTNSEKQSTAEVETKLKEIIIPKVEFDNTPLQDALRYLNQMSNELGDGVNIILNAPESGDTKITLKLTNVPLVEALRYTASLARLKYRIDSNAVVLLPLKPKLDPIKEGWEAPAHLGEGVIAEKLKSIRISSINFKDTPLRDALNFLAQRSVELDSTTEDRSKKGFNIILSGSGPNFDSLITLRLTDVSIVEAIRYTTSLADLRYTVDDHAVVVRAKPAPVSGDLYTNAYDVTGQAIPLFGGDRTAKEILEYAGVSFGNGRSAIYNPADSNLIVRNTADQIELVEAFLEAAEQGKVEAMPAPGENSIAVKLMILVLPKADFKETPLPDVLRFLQQRSVELDLEETDREKKGINIIIEELDRAEAAKVTLKVTNVSFEAVLRYVGELAGFEHTVETHAVVFRPKN